MYISENFYNCLLWVSIGLRPTKTRKHIAIASHVEGGEVVKVNGGLLRGDTISRPELKKITIIINENKKNGSQRRRVGCRKGASMRRK